LNRLTTLPGGSRIQKANKKRNYSGSSGAAPAGICSEVLHVISAIEHCFCPAFASDF
jgi:hypothetical protein